MPITRREIHCTLQREFPWEFPWGFPTLLEGSAPQQLGTVLFSTTIIIDDSMFFTTDLSAPYGGSIIICADLRKPALSSLP